MIDTVLEDIIDTLGEDSTLTGYLGNTNIVLGWLPEDSEIPCVTVTENNESSTLGVGYNQSKKRTNNPTVQIDIWMSRDSQTIKKVENQIVPRIDVLLMTPGNIEDTWGWRRVSSSGPSPDPDDARLIHKALRYEFFYKVTD